MKKQIKASASDLSRRDFLQVFAAGAATAVGTIALEVAPLANIAGAQDNTLRIAWLTPATLDPRSASGDSEIAILNALYDYLIETDAAANLVPRLASSWDLSDDGMTYT
ncbi:MAG: twin-arginine translocation signal domain-containing protein, partial [Chloroflexi bacterium]|nr:twin-arginine translocation signal domain-containing protein [Chloroflexota bacterium]